MNQPPYIDVALLRGFARLCTYRAAAGAMVGSRVRVTLGRKQVVGIVVAERETLEGIEDSQVKPVQEVLDAEPVVDGALLAFLVWSANYYFAQPAEMVRAALPGRLAGDMRARWQITDGGREALEAQQAALRRADLDLEPHEAALLGLLQERRGQLTKAQGKTHAKSLKALLKRGFIARDDGLKTDVAGRTDLLVTLTEQPQPAKLGRARRQAELYEALVEAGTPVRLTQLPGLPAGARGLARKLADKGLVSLTEVPLERDPFEERPKPDQALPPTVEQAAVLSALLDAVDAATFHSFLLHGVTGSGKTEVYLQLIERVLSQERTALVLVPEIALTPQLAQRFRARFPDSVAVLHSGLTEAERFGQWRRIRAGELPIVVGARSAVFAPLQHLGAVIVDEEHDASFKQEDGVRYNARDLALVRAQREGAVAVLGSATPSLESYHRSDGQRLALLQMHDRATGQRMPGVELIDLRRHRADRETQLTAVLDKAIRDTLEQGQQVILLLNRRGYSTFVLCKACGLALECENCSVSLTHHRSSDRAVCHYCGYHAAVPERCTNCDAPGLEMLGAGTERIEEALCARYPLARVARLDRDTAGGRGLQNILRQMRNRELDILVGTQIVAKGHDFPAVTCVGVLCADLGLNFPDFRAAERTYQLLSQVAGRAGRAELPGRVLIQTYRPDHFAILAAQQHDYRQFFDSELKERREVGYPPAIHMAAVHFDGADADTVRSAANRVATALRRSGALERVALAGPAAAPLRKLKGRTRWMLLLKAETRKDVRQALHVALSSADRGNRNVRVSCDVDPVQML